MMTASSHAVGPEGAHILCRVGSVITVFMAPDHHVAFHHGVEAGTTSQPAHRDQARGRHLELLYDSFLFSCLRKTSSQSLSTDRGSSQMVRRPRTDAPNVTLISPCAVGTEEGHTAEVFREICLEIPKQVGRSG